MTFTQRITHALGAQWPVGHLPVRIKAPILLGLLLLAAPIAGCTYAAPATDGLFAEIKPAQNGTFKLGRIEFGVQHKSWSWAPARQRDFKPALGYPQSTPDSQTVRGKFVTDSGTYDFTQELRQTAPDRVTYSAGVSGTPTKESRFLCLSLLLPVDEYKGQKIFFDDQPCSIPWWFVGQNLLKSTQQAKTVRIPLKEGGTLVLAGDLEANFQDNREYAGGSFDLQIFFNPHSGSIRTAKLDLTISKVPGADPLAVAYDANAKQPPRAKPAPPKPQNFKPDAARVAASLARVRPLSPVLPRGEEFVDESGKPVRFWGMNLVAFYPDYALAEQTADHLAALGINLVRPHHNLRPSRDWSPAEYSALVTYEADSRTPNLKAWDRYDYLNARLREKGIYLALSAHSSRTYLPDDVSILKVSPEDDEAWASAMDDLNHWSWRKATDPRKMLPVFDERCFLLNAEYVRTMLTHVNPYTGLTYGKDPQVVSLELINEFSSEYTLLCGNKFPEYWTNKLDAMLKAYALAHDVKPFTLYASKTEAQKKCFSQFCNELDESYAQRMKKVVRDAGYNGPIEFSNLWRGDAQLRWRAKFDDVIEDHAYEDPLVVNDPNRFLYFGTKSAVAGKPVILGEFNQSENSNLIKERRPVLSMLPMAATAYSSLQNYAGVVWFAWTHGIFGVGPDGWGKPGANSPIGVLAGNDTVLAHLRTCGIIFKNGYLKPSAEPQTVTVDDSYYPRSYNDLLNGQTIVQPGWQAVHGFRKAFGPIPPAQQNAPWQKTAPPQPAVSDTGQIVRDAKRRQLSFAAPKTEGFSGYLDGQPIAKLGVLGVPGDAGFATVIAVGLDDLPLRQSRHILLSRTCTDTSGKASVQVPVTLTGLALGDWTMKTTRPTNDATQSTTLQAVAGKVLTLPATDWSECEIELR
jgi:hypothetical protein